MVRTRLAALAVAAGLCGCSTLANHPWFNHTPRPVSECAGSFPGASLRVCVHRNAGHDVEREAGDERM